LKEVTDYVGLGHTHKHFEIDNWAFNPGSLEITSVNEYRETRGAFVVDVDEDNNVNAQHVRDYRQRPFQQLSFDVSGYKDTKDITEELLKKIDREARRAEDGEPSPIIEITLRGQLGFPNSQLEMQKIRDDAREMSGALHIRVKNNSVPVEYAVAIDMDDEMEREKVERRVIEDLIIRDSRYNTAPRTMADAVIGAKRLALSDDSPDKIAEFISMKINDTDATAAAE
jgi:exonuclease SbcD